MGLIQPELTIDCSLSSKPWIPKTTGDVFAEVSTIDNVSDKILKLNDYVSRLQDEMMKIDAFKRELPLCMILLNDAIATVKEEMQCRSSNCKPIFEEFIPLKKNSTDEKDEKIGSAEEKEINNSREKMNWMSSVQLWNSGNNKKRKEEDIIRPMIDELLQSRKNRTSERAFAPFKRCDKFPVIGKEDGGEFPGAPSLSLRTPENKEEIYCNGFSSKSCSSRSVSSSATATNSRSNFNAEQQQSGRKQRRCWSPELHRRFVSALQQLGGAQAATPKQIREFMQVDGLTNDEVKSHLQKYRLHSRRVPPTTNTPSIQPSGILGGLWMSEEQRGESSKLSNSLSGSPQNLLQLTGSSRGTSITRGDSMEEEDDDEKSESHSWKSHKHSSRTQSDA